MAIRLAGEGAGAWTENASCCDNRLGRHRSMLEVARGHRTKGLSYRCIRQASILVRSSVIDALHSADFEKTYARVRRVASSIRLQLSVDFDEPTDRRRARARWWLLEDLSRFN